jgi:endonuclease/exonuclease/phosphatase (EEP) superfamily protein YafD
VAGSWAILRAVVRAAAFVLAGAGLVGGLVAQGGRFSPWLDLASHFAPIWLGAALLAGLWAALGERSASRRVLLVLAALGAATSGALIAPELTRPLPRPAPPGSVFRLRLIQFNTWENLADPTGVADWIASQRPDVVTIEDVTKRLREALIQRGFQYMGGVENVAIFSRPPRVRAPFVIPRPMWPNLPAFSRASFAGPDGGPPFTVVAVHLTWPTRPNRWPARAALAALLDRYPHDRLIVAGDFNLTPWSFALRRLDRRLGLERRDRAIPTWPAWQPQAGGLVSAPAVLPIDHVYAGAGWRTVAIGRGPRLGSDHYPLIVDLALVAPPDHALPAASTARRTGAR